MNIKIAIKGNVRDKGFNVIDIYPKPNLDNNWNESIGDQSQLRDIFGAKYIYAFWKNEYGNYYSIITDVKTDDKSNFYDDREGKLILVIFTGKKIFNSGHYVISLLKKLEGLLIEEEISNEEIINQIISDADNSLMDDYCPARPLTNDIVYRKFNNDEELEKIFQYPNQIENQCKKIYIVPKDSIKLIPAHYKEIKTPIKRTFFIKLSPQGVSVDNSRITEGEKLTITYSKSGGYKEETIPVLIDGTSNKYIEYDGIYINVNDATKVGIKFKRRIQILCQTNNSYITNFNVIYKNNTLEKQQNSVYIFNEDINNYEITITAKGYKTNKIIIKSEDFTKGKKIITLREEAKTINAYFHGYYGEIKILPGSRLFNAVQHGRTYDLTEHINRPLEPERNWKNKIMPIIKGTLLGLGFFYFLFTLYSIFKGSLPWPFNLFTEDKVEVIDENDSEGDIQEEDNNKNKDEQEEERSKETNQHNVGEKSNNTNNIQEVFNQQELEQKDIKYMKKNDSWNIDSIKSDKYKKLSNCIKQGNINYLITQQWFPDGKNNINGWWGKIIENLKIINTSGINKQFIKDKLIKSSSNNSIDLKSINDKLEQFIQQHN